MTKYSDIDIALMTSTTAIFNCTTAGMVAENELHKFREEQPSFSYHEFESLRNDYEETLKKIIGKPTSSNKQNLAPGLEPNEELEAALRVIGKSTALGWAEGLILQLPKTHDGRNSWLLNHGRKKEALEIQQRHANRK